MPVRSWGEDGENPLMAGDARLLAWALGQEKVDDLDATSPDATGDTVLARQASPRCRGDAISA